MHAKGDTITIWYLSRRSETGLTDVKIIIWNPSAAIPVDEEVLTEAAHGKYYYKYPIPADAEEGVWSFLIDSASNPSPKDGEFQVSAAGTSTPSEIADVIWDEPTKEHRKANTLGYHAQYAGGPSVIQGPFTSKDKSNILNSLMEILSKLEQDKKLDKILGQNTFASKDLGEIRSSLNKFPSLFSDDMSRIRKDLSRIQKFHPPDFDEIKSSLGQLKDSTQLQNSNLADEINKLKSDLKKLESVVQDIVKMHIKELPDRELEKMHRGLD